MLQAVILRHLNSEIMKQAILSNWNFIRLLRLGIGIAIIIQAVMVSDIWFSVIGIVLAGLALLNIGCCGTGNCYAPVKENTDSAKEIIYEEVVNDK